MKIKVVSLWQPWAWAMWNGLKEWETRDSWSPVVAQLRRYRGWLGIHAAKKPFRFSDYEEEFTHNFRRNCAGVELLDEITTKQFESQLQYGVLGGICNFSGNIIQTQQAVVGTQERFWGNYETGRRAIHCPGMVKLPEPVRLRGAQGLFEWEVPPNIREMLQ